MPASGESALAVSEEQREQRRLTGTKTAITNDNIQAAVSAWCFNSTAAAETYGNISDWDTSGVTDGFYALIYEDCGRALSNMITTSTFNEDISDWNTSSATTMNRMFYQASSFNRDVSGWDVSRVINMELMFREASSFNIDLTRWDISRVVEVGYMFYSATSFDQVLCWDTSGFSGAGTTFMFMNSGVNDSMGFP